jgi:hypothetical protein
VCNKELQCVLYGCRLFHFRAPRPPATAAHARAQVSAVDDGDLAAVALGFRFRIRPAGQRSEILFGAPARALKKKQAEATPEPSEGLSRSGETSTELPS